MPTNEIVKDVIARLGQCRELLRDVRGMKNVRKDHSDIGQLGGSIRDIDKIRLELNEMLERNSRK